jgi:hypothetical protein
MNPAVRTLVAIGSLVALAPVLYTIDRKGWDSPEAAGWVQAIGTIGAVLGSAFVARQQMRHASKLMADQLEHARHEAERDRADSRRTIKNRQAVVLRAAWTAASDLSILTGNLGAHHTRGTLNDYSEAGLRGWAIRMRDGERMARVLGDLETIPVTELPNDEAVIALLEARRAAEMARNLLTDMIEGAVKGVPTFVAPAELAADAYRRFSRVLEDVLKEV